MHSSRQLRDARGPVAASMATSAALLTHLAGGGALPGWLGILVPWVLSLAVCTVLAGRRLSLWRLSVSVAVSQVLFHTLFVLGTPTAAAGSPAGRHTGQHAGHGLPGGSAMPPPTTGSSAEASEASAHLAGMIQASPAMWLWHGVAAVATIAALYSGERALHRLRELAGQMADWLRRRRTSADDVALPFPVVRTVAPDWFTGSFPARPEVSPSRRRGPPRAHAI